MNKKLFAVLIAVIVALGFGYFMAQQNDKDSSPNQTNQSDISNSDGSATTLDLSGQGLTSLPESVLGRTDITTLNLSNNQLTSLPAGISNLTNLRVLNVENNRLVSLPPEISQLTSLREILANNNRMTSLPNELGNMTWLESLDISGNSVPSSDVSELKAKLTDTQVKS